MFLYLADEINASGGLLGKKVEIVGLDNKTNPQESLIQAQKAADQGIRIITQGNGSSVAAALSGWVSKYNDRNPGKEIIYLNYAVVDPVLTNDKCSYWHFRWDANSDIKMAAPWRREIHAVQPCQRPPCSEFGRSAAAWRVDNGAAAIPDQSPLAVAQLPNHQHLSQPAGRRELRCAVLRSLGHRYAFWTSINRLRDVRERAEWLMERIGMTARRSAQAGVLSYAEQRALEIGVTIGGAAEVILLDEPTAGMNNSETEQAVALIRKVTEDKTLVMAEHDMGVVFNLADRISVLVYGEIIACDTPQRTRENAAVHEAYLGQAEH